MLKADVTNMETGASFGVFYLEEMHIIACATPSGVTQFLLGCSQLLPGFRVAAFGMAHQAMQDDMMDTSGQEMLPPQQKAGTDHA